MLGSRALRIAAAIFVATAVFQILWPRATGYVSTFAVVNAPVMTVRAPINGIVEQPSPTVGTAVARDDVVLALRARATGPDQRARLMGERVAKQEQLAALTAEIDDMRALKDALRRRAAAEIHLELAFLTQKLNEEQAIRRMHAAEWDKAQYAFAARLRLQARGTASDAEVQGLDFELARIEALMSASEARIAALLVEIAAIEAELPSPGGTGRRPAAHDRFNDLDIALSDLRTRRRTVEGVLAGIETALSTLDTAETSRDDFRPVAAADGVIWTASGPAGSSVTAGSDLYQTLDCRRRFLEVVFDERAFDDLPPGTRATVRLRGSDHTFETVVISRHAAGGGPARSATDAAVQDPYDKGGIKVFLGMAPADPRDDAVAASFCDVGRTAEVRIQSPALGSWIAAVRTRVDNLAALVLSDPTEVAVLSREAR